MRQISVRPPLFPKATRRLRRPDASGAGSVAPRFLEHECYSVLRDSTDAREARLLEKSNERFERVRQADPNGEVARLAAFEAGYLALATVVTAKELKAEHHPSAALISSATGRLPLLADDTELAIRLGSVYAFGGWETLDFEALCEWCNRIRLAVGRYLQAR